MEQANRIKKYEKAIDVAVEDLYLLQSHAEPISCNVLRLSCQIVLEKIKDILKN